MAARLAGTAHPLQSGAGTVHRRRGFRAGTLRRPVRQGGTRLRLGGRRGDARHARLASLAGNPHSRNLFDGVSAAGGAPAPAGCGAGTLSASAGLDALELLVEALENLVRAQVEDGASRGGPAAPLVEEDHRGVAQVSDRGQALHVAAFDRLEPNGDADENGELSGPPVARQGEAI